MTNVEIVLKHEIRYPVDPESEASAIARGWRPRFYVTAEYPRDPLDPDQAIYFRLLEPLGCEPVRYENPYEGEDQDAALEAAIAAQENGAAFVRILEVSAYDREMVAAERAFESRF